MNGEMFKVSPQQEDVSTLLREDCALSLEGRRWGHSPALSAGLAACRRMLGRVYLGAIER